jgi:hypothetical protein
MIVYNVTFSVDKEVGDEWISWMKDQHLPSVSMLFESFKILKVLSHDDEQTLSFAVQYFSKSIESIEKYSLNDEIEKRYGDRVLAFPTLLKEV